MGTILSVRLKEIRDAERDNGKLLCEFRVINMGNAVFEHEERYSKCTFPNIDYQLLSLFRLWNAIQYYFPYKYLLKDNWNEILLNHIPLFLEITSRMGYESALRGLFRNP